MNIIGAIAPKLRNTPARLAYHWAKSKLWAGSQSDEAHIIASLAKQNATANTFIEFGFHPSEFNCVLLRDRYEGLLVDGDESTVRLARKLLPKNVQAVSQFLTLDNIGFLRKAFDKVGVLSVDVDGNDYWFLKELIDLKPDVISCEYNATFGQRSVSVPYKPDFNRFDTHAWYHGCSLIALERLCKQFGYGLAAVSESGVNAFFTKAGQLSAKDAWRPHQTRCTISKLTTEQQWSAVSGFQFVDV